MNAYLKTLKRTAGVSLAFAAVWAASPLAGADNQPGDLHYAVVTATADGDDASAKSGTASTKKSAIIVKAFEPTDTGGAAARKETAWLGVATEEASEALTSQLGLDAGVGLVVTYIGTDSPAAKAGVQKNDVLVELEGQLLVHPAQLRKLVQVRKAGDTIKFAFYRAGKKQTISATLAKNTTELGLFDDEPAGRGVLRELQLQLKDLPIREAIRDQMQAARDALSHVQIDQKKIQEEVRRSVEAARKAVQQARRSGTNVSSAADPTQKALEDLSKSGVMVDNNATVTVRSTGQKVKSLVQADESGTLVLVSNPKLHLTAHDKDGNLQFDGEIETTDQRDRVPRKLWQKVEPLLKKMVPDAEEELEAKPEPSKKISLLRESGPSLIIGLPGGAVML